MNLSETFTELKNLIPSRDYERPTVSGEYFSSSLTSKITIYHDKPSVEEVDEALDSKFDLGLEQALQNDYDRNEFDDKERGQIEAYRSYVEDIVTEIIPQERNIANHAAFEGADKELSGRTVEDEEYLQEKGLL